MEYAIVLLPLLGSIISGFFGKRLGAKSCQILTSSFVSISAILSFFIFYDVLTQDYSSNKLIFNWISSGSFHVNWSINIDPLTSVMLVVVSLISSIIHFYSIGYMDDDPHKARFMAYLSLFTFAMLTLVTADNFLQLYFGWEGVGLCSYLLIGFWYKKPSANAAAIKAFIVNRVGDFGFAIGIFLIFFFYGTVNYNEVFQQTPLLIQKQVIFLGIEFNLITLICLLLFVGAMGKSAQILLHTWLPDAMEGPTPVSALIHAATMVTAGVFLVVRCSPIFEYSQVALNVVTVVGMTTAFFAATVALVQNDIKKIVAYSTCSQLGYMFFAAGVGAYQPYLTEAAALGTQAGTTMGGVSPYISAAGALTGTGAGTGAGSIASYMSPYQQQVIDTSLAEFDRQAAARQQGISDQAVALGGFGGGREGVQLAEYQTQSDRNRALLQAGMQQQGFGIGQQARQQDLMNQLTLGGAQAGLAQGQMGLGGYQQGLAQLAPQLAGGDIGTLSQIGGIQQQQSQNVLNAQQQAAQMGAMEPYQRMGVYGQGLQALAPFQGQMQTNQTADPTALQTALGWTSVLGGIMNPN